MRPALFIFTTRVTEAERLSLSLGLALTRG